MDLFKRIKYLIKNYLRESLSSKSLRGFHWDKFKLDIILIVAAYKGRLEAKSAK